MYSPLWISYFRAFTQYCLWSNFFFFFCSLNASSLRGLIGWNFIILFQSIIVRLWMNKSWTEYFILAEKKPQETDVYSCCKTGGKIFNVLQAWNSTSAQLSHKLLTVLQPQILTFNNANFSHFQGISFAQNPFWNSFSCSKSNHQQWPCLFNF